MSPTTSLTPSPAASPAPITTFKELIRHESRITDRDLMAIMKVSFTTLKERERDPSKLSMEQLFRVAAHLEKPLDYVMGLVLAEVQEKVQQETEALRAGNQPLGRKYKRKGSEPTAPPAPAKRKGRPVGNTRKPAEKLVE